MENVKILGPTQDFTLDTLYWTIVMKFDIN